MDYAVGPDAVPALLGSHTDATAPQPIQDHTADIAALRRAWRNEAAAPELLEFARDAYARVAALVENQEDWMADSDAAAADGGGDPGLALSQVRALYEMELDRVRYVQRACVVSFSRLLFYADF